jgi:REP element-mobilizing transposase RayT
MPRGARLDTPGALHHVIARGIEKGLIVIDDDDRNAFLSRMGGIARKTSTQIYAFAIMNNHVHILLRSGPQGLSTYMRRLLTSYAQYFNRRHKRVGHLFQNRYKSIICEEEAYFDKLLGYIHLNPLRSGLVKSFEALGTWPWTGHSILTGNHQQNWLDRQFVLDRFGKHESEARDAYLDYICKEFSFDREDELAGEGLRRSKERWSEVKSIRVKGSKPFTDERILGSEEFTRQMLDETGLQLRLQVTADERVLMIERDIATSCEKAGISEAFLRSGARSKGVPIIRKKLAEKFVTVYGLSFAETARHLGVTTNAVLYMLRKASTDKLPE